MGYIGHIEVILNWNLDDNVCPPEPCTGSQICNRTSPEVSVTRPDQDIVFKYKPGLEQDL